MVFSREKLIKSPLNYVGGKFKLLPQILPLIPEDIDTFVDLFCGGCNVGINIKANNVIFNDSQKEVIDLIKYWKKEGSDNSLKELENVINRYQLSRLNENGYKKLREDYNEGARSSKMFYALIVHSFNNNIRFNKKNNFNVAFGKNRSDFNKTLKGRFIKFIDSINENHIFKNEDFREIDLNFLKENDFVYCDPPYLLGCANYNEHGGWDLDKEKCLLQLLDDLNSKNIRFAMSNVLQHKGQSNEMLKEWSKKYNVHYLNHNYNNCNYHCKNKNSKDTLEVLITNY